MPTDPIPTDLRFPAPDGTIFQTRAVLICVQQGQVLLNWDRRYPDFYTLPGGAIQTGESSEAAARREWQEETGQVAGDLRLCGMVENFFVWEGRACHEFGFFYRLNGFTDLPPTVLDNPDVTFCWLPVAELGQHTIYPDCLPQLLQVPAGQVGHFVVGERQP